MRATGTRAMESLEKVWSRCFQVMFHFLVGQNMAVSDRVFGFALVAMAVLVVGMFLVWWLARRKVREHIHLKEPSFPAVGGGSQLGKILDAPQTRCSLDR